MSTYSITDSEFDAVRLDETDTVAGIDPRKLRPLGTMVIVKRREKPKAIDFGKREDGSNVLLFIPEKTRKYRKEAEDLYCEVIACGPGGRPVHHYDERGVAVYGAWLEMPVKPGDFVYVTKAAATGGGRSCALGSGYFLVDSYDEVLAVESRAGSSSP